MAEISVGSRVKLLTPIFAHAQLVHTRSAEGCFKITAETYAELVGCIRKGLRAHLEPTAWPANPLEQLQCAARQAWRWSADTIRGAGHLLAFGCFSGGMGTRVRFVVSRH